MIPARLLTHEEERKGQPYQQKSKEIVVTTSEYPTLQNHDHSRDTTVQVQIERPNIFVLYEQNIGLLSPLIAEELKDAAEQYPPEWIEDAFREAVQYNKRKWSYIRAILRRWETEGRQSWNA
ncbi:MAG: DnaD domain protein [Ktedonobacteraceae bacterium]|nr:DnaD domain protein [Ktedonobacteraceae bacterium]